MCGQLNISDPIYLDENLNCKLIIDHLCGLSSLKEPKMKL